MHTYVSLLRGINVSGKHRLPMITLQNIYQALGGRQVITYIQSGNVVFQSARDTTDLAEEISAAIQKEFGYTIPVYIQELNFFKKIVTKNPFHNQDPSTLYVTILGNKTYHIQLTQLASKTWRKDRFHIEENVVYVHCPDGYGKTAFHNKFFERKGKIWATTRNWKTICKLVELATSQQNRAEA